MPDAIDRIVVGLDGSPHAAAAVRWAARMAQAMGSEVWAVYAMEVPTWYVDYPGYEAETPPPQLVAQMRRELAEIWTKPLADAGVTFHTQFKEGRASTAILATAEEVDADLIVVGRRGRGRVGELVLGSVSHELALHSKRPMLLIPSAGAGG